MKLNKNIIALVLPLTFFLACPAVSFAEEPAEEDHSTVAFQSQNLPESSGISVLGIISLAMSVVALGLGVYTFVIGGRTMKDIGHGLRHTQADVSGLETEHKSLKREFDAYREKTDESLDGLFSEVSAVKQKHADNVAHSDGVCRVPASETIVFPSKTLYGQYLMAVRGVPDDQLSETKTSASTLKLVTTSEYDAEAHIVDDLGKTQFGILSEGAVDIVDGNPQEYNSIVETEAGKIHLDGENWVLTQKIKVKLC